MTHLVDEVRILGFVGLVGFAWPELALWRFARLHAAATGIEALAPVVVTRSVKAPMRPEHDEVDDLDDFIDEVQQTTLSDSLKQQAYGEWQSRAAEHPADIPIESAGESSGAGARFCLTGPRVSG